MKKEMRKLCSRGNSLIRKFKFCSVDVKCTLFRSFCYSIYCISLWSNYKRETFQRLRVNYNNIMRRMMGVPTYNSASFLFGCLGVKSLMEVVRTAQFSLMERVKNSANGLIIVLNNSDVTVWSSIRECCNEFLFQ